MQRVGTVQENVPETAPHVKSSICGVPERLSAHAQIFWGWLKFNPRSLERGILISCVRNGANPHPLHPALQECHCGDLWTAAPLPLRQPPHPHPHRLSISLIPHPEDSQQTPTWHEDQSWPSGIKPIIGLVRPQPWRRGEQGQESPLPLILMARSITQEQLDRDGANGEGSSSVLITLPHTQPPTPGGEGKGRGSSGLPLPWGGAMRRAILQQLSSSVPCRHPTSSLLSGPQFCCP